MSVTEWLHFVRGPLLGFSLAVFVLGLVYRVVHNYLLGRKASLAKPGGGEWGPGLATIYRRSLFHPGMNYRGYFTLIAGYTFHIGFLVTLFLFTQHIDIFRAFLGFGWPGLPPGWIDAMTILSIAALIAVLIHRLMDPVRRLISDFQDYFTWVVTILPLVTGFMLVRRIGPEYTQMLTWHILSFELLLIVTPFTKLSHMVTIFIARWYNGAIAGFKGVQV
jgi:nitrate reductase gamma subunit